MLGYIIRLEFSKCVGVLLCLEINGWLFNKSVFVLFCTWCLVFWDGGLMWNGVGCGVVEFSGERMLWGVIRGFSVRFVGFS